MTDLSIIIVCYRGWNRLLKCLDSLNLFKGDKFSFEVIVVDNNSGDGTISKFEKQFVGFKFIHNKVNGGYANGNNLGSRSALGEYILFLNPDTVISETEIEKLLKLARSNPGYSLISCQHLNENGKETNTTGSFPSIGNLTGFQRTVSKLFTRDKGEKLPSEGLSFPDWVSGSLMLIRKSLFQEINGFYEGFWMYYEDVDLCRRIRDNGGKIVFARNITIEHNHGGSSRANLITTSITKTEVMISLHLYISRHFRGAERNMSQIFLVTNNIISGAVMAVIGIPFFFIPGIFVRTIIFIRLVKYYICSGFRRSWISPRSVVIKV